MALVAGGLLLAVFLGIPPTIGTDPLGAALALEQEGRRMEAIHLLEREGQRQGATAGATLLLSAARMCLRHDRSDQAHRLAKDALALAPGNGRVGLECARILRQAGDPREALAVAAAAASVDLTVRFAAQELRFDILATLPRRPASPAAPLVATALALSLFGLGLRAWGAPREIVRRRVPGGALETGMQVGEWIVERPINQGLHARLFLGREVRTGRKVAMKQAIVGLRTDDPMWARFRQEIETLATLGTEEPGIPRMAVFHPPDLLVTEWIEGETFEELARRLPWQDVLRLGVETARTLARIHAKGVVHRDVKPANLMRERATGRPVLLDFGIARVAAGQGLTVDASLPLGTFGFMAPEQFASASQAGPAADQYGLALSLLWLLAGRMPTEPWLGPRTFRFVPEQEFKGPTLEDIPYGHPVATREACDAVAKVLARGWSELPEHRFADMQCFAEALENVRAMLPSNV
ncbi:MAG: serine/threonine-protein kinase [Candidatus Sericytochromatia bacterium]|nr:serine/threonine-protein kinase [Candidatus Sericytochromatia bacterium]